MVGAATGDGDEQAARGVGEALMSPGKTLKEGTSVLRDEQELAERRVGVGRALLVEGTAWGKAQRVGGSSDIREKQEA